MSHCSDLSFFRLRNPLVGLLDPLLHTPQFVHSTSFTLFSVVTALGCALSTNPRDQILYPTLAAIADANIRWSMANLVKSIEIVQALILMAYWGPAHEKQRDDPYWLRLSHVSSSLLSPESRTEKPAKPRTKATQLARELGIGRSHVVMERATMLEPRNHERRERMMRNMERTWLYVFIADKSFGITTGRTMCFSWKEIPADVSIWWQKPATTASDRMISEIVEMRVVVVSWQSYLLQPGSLWNGDSFG